MEPLGVRVALVTGGPRGIGRAIGRDRAGAGPHVVHTGTDATEGGAHDAAGFGLVDFTHAVLLDHRDRGARVSTIGIEARPARPRPA